MLGYWIPIVTIKKDPGFPLRHLTDDELNQVTTFITNNWLCPNRILLQRLVDDELEHRRRIEHQRKIKEHSVNEQRLLERLDITL